jgi:hypothetical protein
MITQSKEVNHLDLERSRRNYLEDIKVVQQAQERESISSTLHRLGDQSNQIQIVLDQSNTDIVDQSDISLGIQLKKIFKNYNRNQCCILILLVLIIIILLILIST